MNFKMFKLSSAAVLLAQRCLLLSSTCPQISKDNTAHNAKICQKIYLLALKDSHCWCKNPFADPVKLGYLWKNFVD